MSEGVFPLVRPGRPRGQESERRMRRLLHLVAQGEGLVSAARVARVDPERLLALLEEDEGFRGAVFALLDNAADAA